MLVVILRVLFSILLCLCTGRNGHAQRSLDYDAVVVSQNRIDARDLGYPPVDVIPNGESAITSLTIAPNGDLYGATSGAHSHLFVFNPRHGYVQPLGVLPETNRATHGLVVSAVGEVYIGSFLSGHLFRYKPENEYQQPIKVKEACLVSDLGQAVKGETIFALAIDRSSDTIYGLTSPNAHLFKFATESGTFVDLGVVAKRAPEAEKFETEKMMSRMLALDSKGNAYASGESGCLFKFDKEQQSLEQLPLQVPAVPGREPWTRVDAFLSTPDGLIFGGTSDGYLFRFDPEKLSLENLGKPLNQYRIAGLVRGPNGKIYGVGGDEEEMARLFSYDSKTGTYEILGFVDVNRRPYYAWQACVIQAMVGGLDGTVYIGQTERISKLYLFFPW